MKRQSALLKTFTQRSVEKNEVSPSISLQRTRRLHDGAPSTCNLVYTENAWSAANNTLAGCAESSTWQKAEQWIVVIDETYRGNATAILTGCESLANSTASMTMVEPAQFSTALQELPSGTPCMVVLAISSASVEHCASQAKVWFNTETGSKTETALSLIHI